jgi:hypothetical protein
VNKAPLAELDQPLRNDVERVALNGEAKLAAEPLPRERIKHDRASEGDIPHNRKRVAAEFLLAAEQTIKHQRSLKT